MHHRIGHQRRTVAQHNGVLLKPVHIRTVVDADLSVYHKLQAANIDVVARRRAPVLADDAGAVLSASRTAGRPAARLPIFGSGLVWMLRRLRHGLKRRADSKAFEQLRSGA